MQKKINCPVCNTEEVEDIVLLKDYPISNLELSLDKEFASKAKTYDMNIVICKNCSHIYNNIPVSLEYNQKNTTYFTTDKQKKYIQNLVKELIIKYNIKSNKILEIGSGDGLFLKEIVKYDNNGIGYEPSYLDKYEEDNLKIINNYFNPLDNLDKDIDYIAIRHVLEHFENPNKFLKDIINQIIKNDLSIKFIIEVPNIKPTLNQQRINDFIHEHISHFSKYSLKYLLTTLNLDILDMYTMNNEENLVAICKLNQEYISKLQSIDLISNNFNNSIKQLQNDYQEIVKNNKSICIWGAEGRGAGFIKIIKEQLKGDELVIDSDERKWDKYIPSMALKIVSFKELIDKVVDVIIITTSLGKNNILKEIKENNIQPIYIYIITEHGLQRI
jgi:hypothetical protein